MCADLSPLESTAAAVGVGGGVAGCMVAWLMVDGGVVNWGVVDGSVVDGSMMGLMMVDGSVVDRGMVDRGVVASTAVPSVAPMVDGSVVGLVVDVLGVFQGHISNHRHNLKGNISFDLRLRFFRPALVI